MSLALATTLLLTPPRCPHPCPLQHTTYLSPLASHPQIHGDAARGGERISDATVVCLSGVPGDVAAPQRSLAGGPAVDKGEKMEGVGGADPRGHPLLDSLRSGVEGIRRGGGAGLRSVLDFPSTSADVQGARRSGTAEPGLENLLRRQPGGEAHDAASTRAASGVRQLGEARGEIRGSESRRMLGMPDGPDAYQGAARGGASGSAAVPVTNPSNGLMVAPLAADPGAAPTGPPTARQKGLRGIDWFAGEVHFNYLAGNIWEQNLGISNLLP